MKKVLDIAVAVVWRDGLYLVARRHDHVHLGGLWEFPGGKCEPGENAMDAALRELREECAVDAVALFRLQSIVHSYEDRSVRITPVVCRWVAGEAMSLDSQECRWVEPAMLLALEMPPANRPLLEQLQSLRPQLDAGPGAP